MSQEKEKGFTLAEVLVTMAVIGVVAALTIPLLLNGTNNKKFETAFFEGLSILQQSSAQVLNDNNGTIIGAYATPADYLNALARKLKVARTCPTTTTIGNCWTSTMKDLPKQTTITGSNGIYSPANALSSPTILLSNGMSLYIDSNLFTSDCTSNTTYGKTFYSQGGNSSVCFSLYIDTNGIKEPNSLGRDIFFFYYVDKLGFVPDGTTGSTDYGKDAQYCNADVASTSQDNGYTCANIVILNRAMTY